MNKLITLSHSGNITSLTVAELTGKRHDNVMRDIKTLLSDLDLDALRFEGIYSDAMSREQAMFILPKREATLLAGTYDVKVSALILDELERLTSNRSRLEIAEELVEGIKREYALAEQINAQKLLNAKLEWAGEIADNFQASQTSLPITIFAKMLSEETSTKVGGNLLLAFLREEKYLMVGRDSQEQNKPYQQYINHLFEFKHNREASKRAHKPIFTTYITGTGMFQLRGKILDHFTK